LGAAEPASTDERWERVACWSSLPPSAVTTASVPTATTTIAAAAAIHRHMWDGRAAA
jgi:hypothetical protein